MSKALATKVLAWRRSQPNDPVLPALLEFQWPSTAIINAPIPRSARGIAYMVTSMVLAMIVASAIIDVDQVVTAKGIVISSSKSILVQPLDVAIVRSIEVREGQHVRAGSVLARLDPTFASADFAALDTQVSDLEAEVSRWQAEAEGKPFVYIGLDPRWAMQAAIYGYRTAQFESRVENYHHKIAELEALIARSQSDAVGYKERLSVASSIEGMRQQLESKQVGSRLSTLLATDSRAEMARALANAQQAAEAAIRDRAAMIAERDSFVQAWKADISQKLADAVSKLKPNQELLSKAKLRRELVELRSEFDAIVQSIAKVSVGSVMQSGQPFFTLVPADAPLEVESNIFGRENGYVRVGNPVAIKFETFQFSRYGLAEGTVKTISPDSFTAQAEARNPTTALPAPPSADTEPFYRARITIDRVALHGVPEGFHLIPGMPVTTDIKVGRHSVLGYLLGLILPIAQEGMREPS
jgi:HlyD family secretion protein